MLVLNNTRIWAEITSKYLVIENSFPSIQSIPWDETKDNLHFVIILTDRIGDAFNSIYFLDNLRRLYPHAKLTYIGRFFGDSMFLKRVIEQYVDEVLFLECLRKEKDFINLAPDMIFDLNPISTLFPYYPSELSMRIGHHDKCDIMVPQGELNMKANDHLNILRAIGKDVEYSYSPLMLPNRDDKRIFPSWPSRPYIVVCFEATALSWMMPDDVMDALMDYLVDLNKWDVFIIGSDINRHGYCYRGNSTRVYQCTGTLSLLQSICIINGADYVISVDTGLMHAASYIGKPLLAVFTCGQPKKNGPQGQRGATVIVKLRTDPPPRFWQKKDEFQTFKEREFLRLDHVVEGFENLLVAKETTVEERMIQTGELNLVTEIKNIKEKKVCLPSITVKK